jgi:hypothetical protein
MGRAPAHLPESPLQNIAGADGFLPLRRKIIKMQAVKEVFLMHLAAYSSSTSHLASQALKRLMASLRFSVAKEPMDRLLYPRGDLGPNILVEIVDHLKYNILL